MGNFGIQETICMINRSEVATMLVRRIDVCILFIAVGLSCCVNEDIYGDRITPDCDTLIDHTCDVRKTQCQRDLFEVAICARGDASGILPRVKRVNESEVGRALDDSSGSSEEDSTKLDAWTSAYQLLGLLPDDVTLTDASTSEEVSDIVGFYAPETKQLVVVDIGKPMTSGEMNRTLVHEFIHALQDQTVGLDSLAYEMDVTTTDDVFAYKSLVEGEATHYMAVGDGLMNNINPRRIDWDLYYKTITDSLNDDIQTSDAPFIAAVGDLPYTVGGRYITDAWLDGGNKKVASLFDDPIPTAVQWMAGYKGSTIEMETPCKLPDAPDGTKSIDNDRFGAIGVYSLLIANKEDIDKAWELAKEWRGDEIAVFGSTKDTNIPTYIAWRTVWATEDAATEFKTALQDADFETSKRWLGQDAREVLIAASTDGDKLAAWVDNADCEPTEDAKTVDQPSALIRKLLPIRPIAPRIFR
jgi:hypothetical protein